MSLVKKSRMNGTEPLWVSYHEIPNGPSDPFYSRLERILKKYEFDAFFEKLSEPYYAEVMGRPQGTPQPTTRENG